jgi:cytochrome b
MSMQSGDGHVLWDLPTRVFHWALVVSVVTSWLSHEIGNAGIHRWSGYTVLVLVVFRIIWGFLGSRHSRFSDFLRGPAAIRAYLAGQSPARPGHNPLGGWSVLLLLLLLLAQATTGLFNSDGILFDGPFHHALDNSVTDALGAAHEVLFNVLAGLILLHVGAVLYHQLVRKEDLLRPMLWGRTADRSGAEPAVPWWWALPLVLLLGLLLWYAISKAPPPPSYW